MMLDGTLPVTLQYQLRSKLLENMANKIWAPGSQIPSERELCDEYGVSRMTVREVLKDLVQEGYLVRKQGKGTFVAIPKFEHEFTSTYSLSQVIEKVGLQSYFKVLSFKLEKASGHLQQALGLSAEENVYELIRLRYVNEELFECERAYVPASLMEGVTEEQLDRDGLYPTIFNLSGLMADEAEVEAQAINCPADVAKWLQLKKNAAVMHLTRITTAHNRRIAYCEIYIRSETYKYRYKQTLRKKGVYEEPQP
ncbi:GntR family transcriptional regulator [Paenibacillus sp. UNCCL117]|uniref:GntR family transcriptional regulator n=1 Tax=unclassified Paenibacillus TaxID=185978 RepID=UPI0008842931|nr:MULTISPECIES: GntR family transcriptional regulator [unclassified Paenibacillus]SDC15101.1 GntR family transcriptional regulator [Paenibacillus sp. cl123]SFW17468.1 GntR family transcriptional regulator [Paenibacillus sp. UNCCL117]